MIDSSARSLAKTISWRLTGSGMTFLVSYLMVGDFSIAGSIAVMQIITNTILYFFHERLWDKIKWGRRS